MKKILLFVFIFCTNYSFSQIFVNQKNINTSGLQYIEVWEKFSNKNGQFIAMVDYGQKEVLENNKAFLKLHDAKGKVVYFNSIVAMLNYFYINGWELVHVKNMTETDSYLLQKRKSFSVKQKANPQSPSIGSN